MATIIDKVRCVALGAASLALSLSLSLSLSISLSLSLASVFYLNLKLF